MVDLRRARRARRRRRDCGRSSARSALTIADVQVRNRGTIGGNVCSNDPTNHLPPVMVARRGDDDDRGAESERTVPADEFFEGVYPTAVEPGELLTRVTVPARGGGRRRLGLGRHRQGRHGHRQRRRDGSRRHGAHRDRLRRGHRRCSSPQRPTRSLSAMPSRARRPRPARGRPRLGRVPAPPGRGARGSRRETGDRAEGR